MKAIRCLLLVVSALAVAALAAAILALMAPGRTSAQPEPRMVISPASGACDAPLEARGSGFPPPGGPSETLRLYLVQPGTADVNIGILNAASIEPDGTFAVRLGPGEPRCETAALDSELEPPGGHLVIVASLNSEETGVGPGERIPDIIAVAQYAYTTTTVRVPTETLAISPDSGPCDGAVQVSGSGFDPGTQVRLDLARPGSDASLGTLASAAADAAGGFVVEFSLGDLGCQAVQLHAMFGDPTRPQLAIAAYPVVYPTPVPQGIPPSLATVLYTFTSTEVSAAGPPAALPITGDGPTDDGADILAAALLLGLAGMGILIVAASIYPGRRT